ncbi:unnamed protein product [Effrenium voratum]|uniref:Heme NO-binding domain-containing protein n=1 Tax=Effrenium voratum TaxID=2562239 RepID=A0AA36JJQ5_9DINO|nr:unnamed protein product [Effrenium voratum]CAJ1429733.1 unnamed protein product [Effrenium voratum]
MYGHIHIILKDLILTAFGEKTWKAILQRSGCNEELVLNVVAHPDSVTLALVGATCEETKLSAEQALEAFGRHFVLFVLRSGNARFLKAQGSTLPTFLANVNSLHNQLERDHPNAMFPYMEVNYDGTSNFLDLHYLSTRANLSSVVAGVVKEAGRLLFGLDVSMASQPTVRYFRKDAEESRAVSWRVSWTTLDEPPPLPMVPKPKRMSVAALHWAMIDFSSLIQQIACIPQCNPGLDALDSEASRKYDQVLRQVCSVDILLRAVPAKCVAAAWCDPHLESCIEFWETSQGSSKHYEVSQDASFVDVFVSHSWSAPDDWSDKMGPDVDYAEVKATTLAVMAKDYAQSFRSLSEWTDATFWVDKACIAQDHPELKALSIKLLEQFIQKCDSMCVLFTWTYLERLWCVYELACVLIHKPPHKVYLQTELFVKEETLPLYVEAVRGFSLANTKCCKEEDRKVLEAKIEEEYVSTKHFEQLVQATAIALMARSMAFRAGRSPALYATFFHPWAKLARDIGMAELADALECCRCIEWRRATSLNSSASGSVKRAPTQKSSYSKSSYGKVTGTDASVRSAGATSDTRDLLMTSPRSDVQPPLALEDTSPSRADQMGNSMGVNSIQYQQIVADWFELDVAPILATLQEESTK